MNKRVPYKSSGDREYEDAIKEGLSKGELSLLNAMATNKEAATHGETAASIARQLHHNAAESRKHLYSLQQKGLIEIHRDADTTHYKLTGAGLRLAKNRDIAGN